MAGMSLPILLIFFCLTFAVVSVDDNDHGEDDANDTVNSLEAFVVTAETEFDFVNGAKGGDKYRRWYTGKADGANWCATFVSWCADQVGILDNAIPKYQGCDAGVDWFNKRKQFRYTPNYGGNARSTQRGDIIFFCKGNKNDSTHTGIVADYENGTVTTIEGNSSNTVKRRTYSIGDAKILGFATPSYPNIGVNGDLNNIGSLSMAFKFFAYGESGNNYDKGFSAGDGYHALGYYQFDNRYDLQDFLKFCYNSNSDMYSMFKPFLNVKKSSLANNSNLEKAWHTAYKNNPEDFAVKQDTFEYNQYYIPVEIYLKARGIDISNRSDSLKGMCCSLSNWAGSGTAPKIIKDSGANNMMDDKTFISIVYDYLYSLDYNGYVKYGKTGKKYYNGWHNRWMPEKRNCLSYLP